MLKLLPQKIHPGMNFQQLDAGKGYQNNWFYCFVTRQSVEFMPGITTVGWVNVNKCINWEGDIWLYGYLINHKIDDLHIQIA